MHYPRLVPASGWLTIAIVAFGCQSEKTTADEAPASERFQVERGGHGEGIVAKDEQGNEFAVDPAGNALPSDWPRDVPIFPGARVTANARSDEATTLVLLVDQGPQKVIDYYESHLPDMKRKTYRDSGQKVLLVLASEDGPRQVMVSAEQLDESGKAHVHLAVNQGKK